MSPIALEKLDVTSAHLLKIGPDKLLKSVLADLKTKSVGETAGWFVVLSTGQGKERKYYVWKASELEGLPADQAGLKMAALPGLKNAEVPYKNNLELDSIDYARDILDAYQRKRGTKRLVILDPQGEIAGLLVSETKGDEIRAWKAKPPDHGASEAKTARDKGDKRPGEDAPRYANLWFAERREPESKINKYTALVQQQAIFLLFYIGPFDSNTILKDAKPFPSQDALEQAFPDLIGKPIPLEVTFFSQDFETPIAERTQKLTLERGKPTEMCYFPIKPLTAPVARGRLCIFYKNHLLQALNIQATVAQEAQVVPSPHLAQVEMTFSADFNNVERFPERGLWLGINQNVDGSHTLNIKDSQVALSCRQGDTEINNALNQARNKLSEVSFTIEDKKINGIVQKDPITNQPIKEKVYRFYQDNSPKGNPTKRFIDDLTKLADVGSSLYHAVFWKPVPDDEEKNAVENSRIAVKKALEKPCVIQVCRLKEMGDIWPWAVMYDLDLDIDNITEVCERFHKDDESIVPYEACIQNCPHRDSVTAQMNTTTVICPYGFWGFKHIIEQPVQPGGKKAFEDLVFDIQLSDQPVLEMPVESGLLSQEQDHITEMENLKFTVLDTKQEIIAALNSKSQPAPLEPQIVYFFCHGGYDDSGNPMLAIGNNERLRPRELDGKLDWQQSHGLVFINGCHTAELTPKDLANIMWPFVNGGAGGIIGTEITVDTYLACPFAKEFFDHFLSVDPKKKHKVGEIIQEMRLEFLAKKNPLGLVYTPYCSADLHLER